MVDTELWQSENDALMVITGFLAGIMFCFFALRLATPMFIVMGGVIALLILTAYHRLHNPFNTTLNPPSQEVE
jgi:hypothetical protein